ncbi:MAG: hypothetical protein HRU28_02235 [Rhizobiales bacterium]|nr:hypothetical protein [Hyphomicrobiales bacterium]
MRCKKELERESRIILQTMLKSTNYIKQLPFNEMALYKLRLGNTTFVKKLDIELVEYMQRNGWLKPDGEKYIYSEKGKKWVLKFIYFWDLNVNEEMKNVDMFSASIGKKANAAYVELKGDYSPILKLYNRQKNLNNKYLVEQHVQAGQKLFKLFSKANLQPNITMNWDKLESVPQNHYTGEKEQPFGEQVYIARKQLYESLAYVGEEYAAILVEICLFANGLEATEKAMNWPARSGKLLLTMALDKLAKHYKISTAEVKNNKYLSWAKDDFRHSMV